MEMALSCAWLSVAVLLIARAIGQRAMLPLAPSTLRDEAALPHILVVVPVRNEATTIAACIRSLARQRYPRSRLRVRIVDDDSSDGTIDVAAAAIAEEPSFETIECPLLPSGWIGKSHACWIGAVADCVDAPEWLCFIDADVEAETALLASAVEQAERHRLDFLSLAPRQKLRTWSERLVVPCGLYCLAFSQDIDTLQERSDGATATGQFLLMRRRAYFSVGGHAAVRREICEDVALAIRFKQSGWRVALHDGRSLLSTRMYDGWTALKSGFAKNLVETFGGPRRTVVVVFSALVLAWAAVGVPAFEASHCARGAAASCAALGVALAGSFSALGLHLAGARYFAIPLWYGFLFPLGYTLGAVIAFESLRSRLRHRIEWKGRSYA